MRAFNYSEVLNAIPNISGYTIRNSQYKLIRFDNGKQELYDLIMDPFEQNNLLLATLTADQSAALMELEEEANDIRQ